MNFLVLLADSSLGGVNGSVLRVVRGVFKYVGISSQSRTLFTSSFTPSGGGDLCAVSSWPFTDVCILDGVSLRNVLDGVLLGVPFEMEPRRRLGTEEGRGVCLLFCDCGLARRPACGFRHTCHDVSSMCGKLYIYIYRMYVACMHRRTHTFAPDAEPGLTS